MNVSYNTGLLTYFAIDACSLLVITHGLAIKLPAKYVHSSHNKAISALLVLYGRQL